ncbi:MAG: glycosyltransferase [Bacteroidota bacterium]
MKVLHLPYNIASKISITVDALQKIGIEARGISINNYPSQEANGVLTINPKEYGYHHPKKYFKIIESYFQLFRLIYWADIVHWYYDYRVLKTDLVLKWIRFLKKPAVIEWAGSDIRIPDILASHNPFYKKHFTQDYSYKFESLKHSRLVQQKFKDAGFIALVRPELEEFVQQDIYPDYYRINNRINVRQYIPVFPSVEKKRPLIINPVVARGAKGTAFILDAVNKLKQKYEFDFLLLENISHQEIIEHLAKSDIVIDQLILGAFGTTSLEGMALGKPVICFISDKLKEKLPPENPFVNATPDTIFLALELLITNSQMRHETGMHSRKYVEEYHDAEKIAQQLKKIYQKIISRKNLKQ